MACGKAEALLVDAVDFCSYCSSLLFAALVLPGLISDF